ncbi:MAG: PD-(D/E)XK nuclease family protein [Anaerolineae bacterium]|jgi:CRISPR/Cas system-associated exonuclease Cas4 (RecB family)
MILPDSFQFSQGNLQDYVDCPRRFQLRYVRRLRWPAVEAEPALENERYLQQGAAFHRLVHQHLTGIPAWELSRTVASRELRLWWHNYLEGHPKDLPSNRHPEVALSTPIGQSRLVARYDLVALDTGRRAVIVDWKTTRRRPERAWLLGRLQTRVYPYLLVQAGAQLNSGVPIRPEQVTMMYWFASFPADSECVYYNSDQYRADHRHLNGLVAEIRERFEALNEDRLLPCAGDERSCQYCRYRSLCQRGVEAGSLDEMLGEAASEDPFDFGIDFEQIAELEYR